MRPSLLMMIIFPINNAMRESPINNYIKKKHFFYRSIWMLVQIILPLLSVSPRPSFSQMGSLSLSFCQVGLRQNLKIPCPKTPSGRLKLVTCGLRKVGPRKPMWRSRVLSPEAIQAVQSLKLAAKSPDKLEGVFKTRISRLLKADLLDTLSELQRQNELVALQVLIILCSLFFFIFF